MAKTTVSSTLNSYERRMQERLRLNIDLRPGDNRVGVEQALFEVGYRKEDVKDYNGQFLKILDEVSQDVIKLGKNVNQPLPNGMKYLEDLCKIGAGAYAMLPEELGEYIQTKEQSKEGKERGISLDFTFPFPMAFLWEMIYADDPNQGLDPKKFWGFRYPLGHLQWYAFVNRLVELGRGILTSAHQQLLYSKEELEQLEQQMRELRERGHLEVDVYQLEKEISAEMASSEGLIKFFIDKTFKYGVVHFACHCFNPSAQEAGVSQAYLSFTVHQEVEMSLNLFNTHAHFKRRFQNQPLIFLNACESGTPLHLQSLNFPFVLIKFGASGVIATSCTIPDNFASAFATKFYYCLLGQCLADSSNNNVSPLQAANTPHYICEALWETRRYFWEKYQNPLGLAYSLYAETDQELKLI